jgi:hypothetical protein
MRAFDEAADLADRRLNGKIYRPVMGSERLGAAGPFDLAASQVRRLFGSIKRAIH